MNIFIFLLVALFFNAQTWAADVKEDPKKAAGLFLGLAGDLRGPLCQHPAFTVLPEREELRFPRDTSFPLKHLAQPVQYVPRDITSDFHSLISLADAVASSHYLDKFGEVEAKIKAENFDGNRDGMGGEGFNNKYSKLKELFRAENITYKKPGFTTVEGGNFIDFPKETKALLGENSVFLTFAGMELDNLWPMKEIEQLKSKIADTDILYKTAKNIESILSVGKMFMAFPILKMKFDNSSYVKEMDAQEKLAYKEKALLISAKILWCKVRIAHELELALADLVILPQREYHLDFELFVTPAGAIVLRAPKGANAYERAVFARQQQILEEHFPGRLIVAQESDPFLFCGISLSAENVFLHPPAADEATGRRFQQFLVEQCGYRRAVAVGDRESFEKQNAGIHCKTQEYVRAAEKACDHCLAKGKDLLRCSRCKTAHYCNVACQKKAWKEGHKKDCVPFTGS